MIYKEFKGTKGEWELNTMNAAAGNRCFIKGVTEVDWCGDWEETKANAKLIAAAPELLEAAQNLLETYKSKGHLLDYDVDISRQAVKKALG